MGETVTRVKWAPGVELEWRIALRMAGHSPADVDRTIAYLQAHPDIELTQREADMLDGLLAQGWHMAVVVSRILWLREMAEAEAMWAGIAAERQREDARIKEIIADNVAAGRTCDKCCCLRWATPYVPDATPEPFCDLRGFVYYEGSQRRSSCELWNALRHAGRNP